MVEDCTVNFIGRPGTVSINWMYNVTEMTKKVKLNNPSLCMINIINNNLFFTLLLSLLDGESSYEWIKYWVNILSNIL